MASLPYSLYAKNPVKSWKALVSAETKFDPRNWAFRGQRDSKFPATSFERHCKRLGLTKAPDILDLEVKLIRDFARHYHLYGGSAPPSKGHTLEWLALMRHYGTPTRLVDFTYSFFVAAYFAVEAAGSEAQPVVWAVNATRLAKEARRYIIQRMPHGRDVVETYGIERDGKPFRQLFMESPLRFVYPDNPIRLNERLAVQQGLFLTPGDVTTTFEKNVRAVPNHKECFVRVDIDRSCHLEIMRKLHQAGVNAATLFPGLGGFALSLRTKSLILTASPPQGVETLEQL